MPKNIKYYPSYTIMSDELKSFFKVVTHDIELQKTLYLTHKVSEVSSIANLLGFKIKAAEVLQVQAGRVLAILEENSDDVELLVSGRKPKTGAQWGRGGGGFLDRAGYWLIELSTSPAEEGFSSTMEALINQFLVKAKQDSKLKIKLINANTFNDVAFLAKNNGFDLSAVNFLSFQAKNILNLSEEDAAVLADC